MSRTVMPRAYRLITNLSMPSRRRWPLRTILGSKVPARSRGTSRSTVPASVINRFDEVPLRALLVPVRSWGG